MMKHPKTLFAAIAILSGCSPLGEYLGFTPIEGRQTTQSYLQNADSSSDSDSSDANAPTPTFTPPTTSPETPPEEEPGSNPTPPDTFVDAGDPEVPKEKYSGGSPNSTPKEIPFPNGFFLNN